MELYTKIQELCQERGMSISQLERKADIGQTTIRYWNKRNPQLKNIQKIANALDVPLEELIHVG